MTTLNKVKPFRQKKKRLDGAQQLNKLGPQKTLWVNGKLHWASDRVHLLFLAQISFKAERTGIDQTKKNRENRGKKWIGESGRRRRRGGGGGVRTQNRDSEGGCVLCEIKDAQNMHTWKQIRDRESGKLRAGSFANCIKSSRVSQLQLSNHKDVVSPHKGAINSLQVLYYSHSHAHMFFFEHFSF